MKVIIQFLHTQLCSIWTCTCPRREIDQGNFSHTAIPVGNNWTAGFSDKAKWIHSVCKAFLFHQTIIFGGRDHKLRTCSRIYIRAFTVSLRMILHKLCQIVIYTWIDNTSIVYQHQHVPETEKFWARNLQMCANGLFIIDYQFVIFFSVGKKTLPELNSLCANPTKWPNTLKKFVGKLPTNCLSVFGHFVNLALKGLNLNK